MNTVNTRNKVDYLFIFYACFSPWWSSFPLTFFLSILCNFTHIQRPHIDFCYAPMFRGLRLFLKMWVHRNFEGLHRIKGVAMPLLLLIFWLMYFLIQMGYSAVCESDMWIYTFKYYPVWNLYDCIKSLSNSFLSNITDCVYVFYIVYCFLNQYML